MSPGWIAAVITGAGFACMGVAAAIVLSSPVKAAEQPPTGRAWAIERCHGGQCEVLAWRYSGPTSCNVDAHSERVAKAQPSGVRLVCVRLEKETKR